MLRCIVGCFRSPGATVLKSPRAHYLLFRLAKAFHDIEEYFEYHYCHDDGYEQHQVLFRYVAPFHLLRLFSNQLHQVGLGDDAGDFVLLSDEYREVVVQKGRDGRKRRFFIHYGKAIS